MKTKINHYRIDATNGLDYTKTIPAFMKYFASIGQDIELPSPFTPETVQISMSRYYDLHISFIPDLKLPDDEDGNPDLLAPPVSSFQGRTLPGGLTTNDDDEDDDESTEESIEESTAPMVISTERINLSIPTEELRKIIKDLTGESFPRMPGEFKEASSGSQDVNISAMLGYYIDGGLCAEWKEVTSA